MTLDSTRPALPWLAAGLLVLGLAACSSEPGSAPMAEEHEEMAHDEHAGHEMAETGGGAPRIFFVEPADGATVTSPVHVVFGAENFIIEPRGEGEIHPGAGHHHIGIDTTCLEPGIVIPTAEPWVHFGDGSAEIDVQLTPGPHHLVIQVGDGEHRTLDEPGLCAEIDITVVEGEASTE